MDMSSTGAIIIYEKRKKRDFLEYAWGFSNEKLSLFIMLYIKRDRLLWKR